MPLCGRVRKETRCEWSQTITFLKEVRDLIKCAKIGHNWRPVQAGAFCLVKGARGEGYTDKTSWEDALEHPNRLRRSRL
jgi:hypothetical protein